MWRIGGRLLIANHLDQSNYLAQSESGTSQYIQFECVNLALSQTLKALVIFMVTRRSLLVDSLDLTLNPKPHPRFPVQGHILSIGGRCSNKLTWWRSKQHKDKIGNVQLWGPLDRAFFLLWWCAQFNGENSKSFRKGSMCNFEHITFKTQHEREQREAQWQAQR